MELSKKMIEKVLQNESIYNAYGNYAILCKRMPTFDEKLDDYIQKIERLYKAGVQVAPILDYHLLPETSLPYKNGVFHCSEGVFLEKKARGYSFSVPQKMVLDSNQVISLKDIIQYISMLTTYVIELEKRASASQDVYDKLVYDFLILPKEELCVNPEPSNFFFHSEKGYTIINVLPDKGEKNKKSIFTYVNQAVFGYGMPILCIDNEIINMMSPELKNRIESSIQTLQNKICLALYKFGYTEEEIEAAEKANLRRFKMDNVVDFVDMEVSLLEKQAEARTKKEQEKENLFFK